MTWSVCYIQITNQLCTKLHENLIEHPILPSELLLKKLLNHLDFHKVGDDT